MPELEVNEPLLGSESHNHTATTRHSTSRFKFRSDIHGQLIALSLILAIWFFLVSPIRVHPSPIQLPEDEWVVATNRAREIVTTLSIADKKKL
ncbi:hypothetical protein HDU99_010846, partial [Rhizoclosmatium hyalinum]